MFRSMMLVVLIHVLLFPRGGGCWEPGDGAATPPSGALELPWRDELCCEGGEASRLPRRRCNFRSLTDPQESAGGACLDIQCRVDGDAGNLTCDLRPRPAGGAPGAGLMAISFQMMSHEQSGASSDDPVACEATDSFACSVSVGSAGGFEATVTVSVSDATAPPVLLRAPPRPAPPVNLTHNLTIEAGLTLLWDRPGGTETGPLTYEVRYSCGKTGPAWQVVSAAGETKVPLDLRPTFNYTVQVRCARPAEPTLWSEWSEPHHIQLPTVSYIPEKSVVRPGENVTVHCLFNDRRVNASDATWRLNLQDLVDRSRFHPVNQWVSQITLSPSEDRMYDLLRCSQKLTSPSKPYAQVYIEGASIDITCETNGDIDAMVCSWISKQWSKTKFRSKWADMTCDVMEESEAAGEDVGEMDPPCTPARSRQDSDPACTIQPLRMNCYKLWVEIPSVFGPIRSKPVYLSPTDHVKPNPPTHVAAVTQSNGVLLVTWVPPDLPTQGLQCQFQHRLQSTARDQPAWKVESSVRVPSAEVAVSDMCRVYAVQVRCMHTNGTGYWSEWSEPAYSTPQNSRAPERGPDFWRIRRDEPNEPKTNVTLLLEPLPVSERSYCVEGLVVQHRSAGGAVTRRRIDPAASSYSFEWDRRPQTVTVEAYNSLGSSAHNINMTLERQPKRRCLRSFHVLLINSTCVSLSWSLLDNSSTPLFMVVQWSPRGQRDAADAWTRLPYTDRPVYLTGRDFFASEEFGFHLYPVFAEGEGEPMYTLATRRDPAVYMLMLIISFLSIVLVVTLVFSQNHSRMKKLVWKDVPNPRNCSWARGLDFKKVDTFDQLFQPPDGLPAWPLLLPNEKISKVIIADRTRTAAAIQNPLASLTSDPKADPYTESETPPSVAPPPAAVAPEAPDEPRDERPVSRESSAQSLVTYATVLPPDPSRRDPPPLHLHDKEGSGSSSSDEGNFSANNSDISGLWDVENHRRSRSITSMDEFSGTSEQEEESEAREEKDLYYPGMDYPAEDEESEDEEGWRRDEEEEAETRKKEGRPAESRPLLGASSLYLPQFRTAACTRHDDGALQL